MRLGLVLWWGLAAVTAAGVVGRAWEPATQHIGLQVTTLPGTMLRGTKHPATTLQVTTHPATTLQVTTHPATTLQVTTHPATTLQVTTHPATTLQVTTHPATTLQVTTHPATTPADKTPQVTTHPATTLPDTMVPVTTHPVITLPVTMHLEMTLPDTTLPVTTHPGTTLPVTTSAATTLPEATLSDYAPQNSPQQTATNQELIHAEELLEKYGYLECVPPGSERNTHLHRLLLYRRRHPPTAPPRHPLDFRLVAGGGADPPPLPTSVQHKVQRVLGERTPPQEDLNVPSVRQNLLSPPWSTGKRLRGSLQQGSRPLTVAVWDPDTDSLHHLPVCSLSQIQEAVTKFQAVYHVGAGGALDTATVGLLASPRCGNPDILMEEHSHTPTQALKEQPTVLLNDLSDDQNPAQVTKYSSRPRRSVTPGEQVTKQPLTAPRSPNSHLKNLTNPVENIVSSVHRAQPRARKMPHDIDAGLEEAMPDQERLREVAQELREATRARHPPAEHHMEWEPHPWEARRRRRRWVEELVEKINSGEEDARLAALTTQLAARDAHPTTHPTRNKRSIYSHLGHPFNEGLITWRLVTSGYSSQLEVGAQRASLALAFRMWSEVIPPVFLEDKVSPAHIVNISIGFGKRSHLGCVTEFDGLGGELGHTLRPDHDAQIHMDDDEHFTLDSDHGTNLVKVAVHEIGHVLGLEHVVRNYSIMYPVYEKALPNQGLELGWEDRKLVQRVYGACVGAFNTLLDFLRWRPDGSLSYNTYFFRRDHYWMYENKYNRTRFGDPLYIQPEWRGLPNDLDGYAHIWTLTKDAHLFFKGEHYYVYDPEAESVAAGYPRRIAQDFHGPPTPKRPLGRTIPSNIDSVYFDKRDENLYFFKGKKVYGYDVSKGSAGCCLPGYPRRIKDEFPPAESGSRPLPRDLDAVYYSYTDKTIFFLKDRLFWELATFNPHDQLRNNNVVGPFYVHHKWYDICDTELDPYHAYSLV